MVSIQTARVANYIQNPDRDIRAFLFHGTDSSLIDTHSNMLCQRLAQGTGEEAEVIRLSEDDLVAEPHRLATEIQTLSMFQTFRIIRVRVSGRTMSTIAKLPWGNIPQDVRVIVEAGNLRRDVKLRQMFEASKRLVALPCHDGSNSASLSQMIRREMSEAGLRMERDVERYLLSALGNDVGVSKSDISKLITYVHNAGEVTVEDVDAVIGDATQTTLDLVVDSILAGEPVKALKEFDKLYASGVPPDVILSTLSQHLLRLLRIRTRIDDGASPEAALKNLRPPVHFKRVNQINQQIRRWNKADLKWCLGTTGNATYKARLNPAFAQQIATNTIIRINHYRDRQSRH